MKKIVLLTVLLAMFVSVNTFAQKSKNSTKQTITIQTSAQCEECKVTIEKGLAYVSGVKKSNLNLDDKKVTITYLSNKVTVEKLKTEISKIGYDADEVKADATAYEKLSPCCKKN